MLFQEIFTQLFFLPKKAFNDVEIVKIGGKIWYDNKRREYMISTETGVGNEGFSPQEYMAFSTRNCIVEYVGGINAPKNIEPLKLKMYGNVLYDFKENTSKVSFDMALFTKTPKAIYSEIGVHLLFNDLKSPSYSKEFVYKAPQKAPENYPAKYNKKNSTKIHLKGMKMNWEPRNKAFISSKGLNIETIGDDTYGKNIGGSITVQYEKGEENITLYLKPIRKEWVFLRYEKDIAKMLTNYEEVQKMVDIGGTQWEHKNKKSKEKTIEDDLISSKKKKEKKTQIDSKLKSEEKYMSAPTSEKSSFVLKINALNLE